MKKVLLSIIALFCSFVASAVDLDAVIGAQMSHGPAYRAGLDISFPINNRWAIMPGVYYEKRNWSATKSVDFGNGEKETDFKINGDYITVPVRASLTLPLRNSDTMFLNMGIYGAYCFSGTYKYNMHNGNADQWHKESAFTNGAICPRLDYGLTLSLSYLLKDHYIFTLYNEMGLRTIYHTDDLAAEIAAAIFPIDRLNLCLGISVGYRF